jgi:hypothetical protein
MPSKHTTGCLRTKNHNKFIFTRMAVIKSTSVGEDGGDGNVHALLLGMGNDIVILENYEFFIKVKWSDL